MKLEEACKGKKNNKWKQTIRKIVGERYVSVLKKLII